jgi:hypothetical protein
MCTVIAKESASRVTVLTGIPCCLSVEHVAESVAKVTRENGWFELNELEFGVEVPNWASWLEGETKTKAIEDLPMKCRGKRVRFVDVGNRYQKKPSQVSFDH